MSTNEYERDGEKKQTVVYIFARQPSSSIVLHHGLLSKVTISKSLDVIPFQKLLSSHSYNIYLFVFFFLYFSAQLLIASVGFFLSREIENTEKSEREREKEIIAEIEKVKGSY